jgi:NADP-dependent 3-hydroxy acid dehydrogenase YdfG
MNEYSRKRILVMGAGIGLGASLARVMTREGFDSVELAPVMLAEREDRRWYGSAKRSRRGDFKARIDAMIKRKAAERSGENAHREYMRMAGKSMSVRGLSKPVTREPA